MPKIVDKEQKRKDIAISCSELIHEVGIKKLTVAQCAKTAGVGKGTIYEYFESKEDIIFEIINLHIEEYHEEFQRSIKDVKTTKEKIFHFFQFVLDDSPENMKHFNGYKEYLSIVLAEDNENMKGFNVNCDTFFKTQLEIIIQKGIDNKELMPQAFDFCEGLLVYEKGLALMKMTNDDFDTKVSTKKFINNLFDLIEIKKEK
ncbi:TetR/AcrR family transcriptional regulator [Poseidonibacter ostreae]|uniref:TetR family transcriptional regulator n=1 Tax=Poseidonibacter ostreae TaxID=2654171 RepID=A0A6L4WQA6_9BACT|nr:TetR/AcrR family transcriptional regulator [Poseidonibacter ostreae]KAB7885830.1 TetR family transcriptional regulator [Poseidonibacter ostreae]KAB7886856.1 TetR family transcriptional regulator [Poseidonibacter ostreae]KAB7889939.1 TetR family transcriptional regulator [Poseidonibacter ostreae]